jgi:protein tyrosine phosphatase
LKEGTKFWLYTTQKKRGKINSKRFTTEYAAGQGPKQINFSSFFFVFFMCVVVVVVVVFVNWINEYWLKYCKGVHDINYY